MGDEGARFGFTWQDEDELVGMQKLSRQDARQSSSAVLSTVGAIPRNAMTDVVEVNPNLMSSACFQDHIHQGKVADVLAYGVVGSCFLSGAHYGHFLSVHRMPPYRTFYCSEGCGLSDYESPILLVDQSLLELFHEILQGRFRLRHKHKAGCVFVESVHNAGPESLTTLQLRIAAKKSVHESVLLVSRRGMHDHSGRLVYDEDRIVLKDDTGRSFFTVWDDVRGWWKMNVHDVTGRDTLTGLACVAVDGNL